jgi:isoamylase
MRTYRVHGPYDPPSGHRYNAAKLLLDPYAKAIAGALTWHDALFGYRRGAPDGDLAPDGRDSAPYTARSVVIDPAFDWGDDHPPRTAWHGTVIYEVHVKGFTARHPELPPERRGTYSGLGSPPVVDYLGRLGVTAVELLPVHHAVTEEAVAARGLTNYWGYNSIGFLSPDSRFSSAGDRGQQVTEFKAMVKALHAAGIEVILDVVYNHTAEGNHLGPTLSFRGIDNVAYYRLTDNRRDEVDHTGCGNTLDTSHPRAIQLIMDSLRYWVLEMHVDGFRFDLAPALGRGRETQRSSFLDVVGQDPVVSRTKLIAEPWDLGEGGYQLGRFPSGWAEWNDRYRNTVRRYWRGDEGQAAELRRRLTGSDDLFEPAGRHPYASVNFVTAHDGFTLTDLVSHNGKHNEANGEDNRDGADDNLSWNCGAEGATDDAGILELRQRQVRNFLATLFLAWGTPMLCAGDEVGRTQRGNNNPYCQDNEISWLSWMTGPEPAAQLEFTRRLIRLRRETALLSRRTFPSGQPPGTLAASELVWLRPDGGEMTEEEWASASTRCVGLWLLGTAVDDPSAPPEPGRIGDTLLVLLNAHHEPVSFVLPGHDSGAAWRPVLDTRVWEVASPDRVFRARDVYDVGGRSVVLIRSTASRLAESGGD